MGLRWCASTTAALLVGIGLVATGAAAESPGPPAQVTVAIAPVSLPEVSGGRVEDVLATVSTDEGIRWSASANIRDWDVTTVTPLPVPTGQEVLAPGTHTIRLGDTTLFRYPGPTRVHFEVRDVETGQLTQVVETDAPVIGGRFRAPRIEEVDRHRSRVVVTGRMRDAVHGMRVEVQWKANGATRFRTRDVADVDAARSWTAAFPARKAGKVRVRLVSDYGRSSFSKPRRVEVRPQSRRTARG